MLSRAGYRVFGNTTRGTEGAVAIREAGGIPTYNDLSRASTIKSDLMGTKANIVIHLETNNTLNGTPHLFPDDWADFDAAGVAQAMVTGVSQAVAETSDEATISRFIYVSACAVYGDQGGAEVDESAQVAHDNAYQNALASAEKAVSALDNSVIVRAGYTYGAYTASTITMQDMLMAGKSFSSSHASNGWIHEDDLASALMTLISAESLDAKVYNAVGSHATPDAFAQAFGEIIGVGTPKLGGGKGLFAVETVRDALMEQSASITCAPLEALGWNAELSDFAAGFDRTTLVWRAAEAPASEGVAEATDSQAIVAS
jgi:nucleoside-diphosphate-sugar epimerase